MAYFFTRQTLCQNKATDKKMMILAVMQRVREQWGIRGFIINNQILHAFKKNTPYLQEAFKNG